MLASEVTVHVHTALLWQLKPFLNKTKRRFSCKLSFWAFPTHTELYFPQIVRQEDELITFIAPFTVK